MRTGGGKATECMRTARGRAVITVTLLLCTSTLLALAACGAAQTRSQNSAAQATPGRQAETPAQTSVQEGDVTITPITHASLQIEYGGKAIHVDPTSPGYNSTPKKADPAPIQLDPHNH